MMWFGMLHLLILNLIIGLIESFIIKYFKLNHRTWMIVLSNYVSMFVGLYIIAPYFSELSGNRDFWGGQTSLGNYPLKGFFVGMVASYFATLILEFPLYYFSIKNTIERKKIFLPFLISNTITNIIMILIYYMIVKDGETW